MARRRTVLHSIYSNFAGPLAALLLVHAVGAMATPHGRALLEKVLGG